MNRHEAPVVRTPLWLRILIPAVLLVGWLAAVSIGGPTFGKLSEVVVNDQAQFLPTSAESTKVQDRLPEFLGDDSVPAIVVAASDTELTDAQLAAVEDLAQQAGELQNVNEVSPAIPSDDGQAAQFIALIDTTGGSETSTAAVEELREMITDIDGLDIAVTGPAGFSADISEAFSGIDGLLLIVALAAVFVILIIVYRSPLLPILVLLTSVSALSASILIVFQLAKIDVLQLSGQTQGILFILVVGAATDYALLYTARYREALRQHPTRWQATMAAWRGAWEPILASGSTVIVGLLCLLLSLLASNQQLGPVAAIGIAVSILAGLTLLPALLLIFGRAAFWPVRPKFQDGEVESASRKRGLWERIADGVEARPRVIWIVSIVLLAAGALGLTQLQANGVAQSEFVVGESQARDGQELLGEHFPAGSGTPTYVLVGEANLEAVADAAVDSPGVDSVALTSEDAPGGSVPYPAPEQGPFADAEPTVADGDVLLQLTLAEPADSLVAQDDIVELRERLHAVDDEALIGGQTAIALDTNLASERDRALIVPIVLVVIMLILMVLLRSVWAAVMLTAATVLSFATALGVAAFAFQVIGIPDMDPSVPLYAFVFLVALGVDYNIFLMTRVREEAKLHGHRDGIRRGLVTTGGVITSAGVVLAATFAALGVIPVLFLLQLSIIVAFGVLLDTTLVRSLLVPALSLELGRKIWWPSKIKR